MLETIWFVIWGVLWAVYFMLDGFDFGVGALLPVLGRDDADRRAMVNSIGPHWDGNEVWLITAGGVTFAAFPITYATMFSSLYSPLMLILLALILRAVAIEFRSKIESPAWKSTWDNFHALGSVMVSILFGVAFANIFQGIPFDADRVYQGTIVTLLNPYGLLGGVFFLVVFLMHGSVWLTAKTEGELQDRAVSTAGALWIAVLALAVVFLAATWFATPLYDNYIENPALFAIIAADVAALLLVRVFLAKKAWWKAWFASSATIVLCVLFGVIGLYPNLFPSSIDPAYSLNISNSSSSELTLKIMLGVSLTFVPIVIIYQALVYKYFSKPFKEEDYHY